MGMPFACLLSRGVGLRIWLIVVVVGLFATACGSTSRDSSTASRAAQSADAGRDQAADLRKEAADDAGLNRRGGVQSAPSSKAKPEATAPLHDNETGGGDPVERAAAIGKGVTPDAIYIGMSVTARTDQTFEAFGTTTGQGDHQAYAEAVVAHLNARGGAAGRELRAIYHRTDANSGTYSSQAQAICSRFTEDEQVLAVVSGHFGIIGEPLVDCLSKRDTPLVSALFYPWDGEFFRSYGGYLYEPSFLSASRWDLWIDRLVEAGFFEGATIGIVRFDGPVHRRIMQATIRPALSRHGLAVTEEFAPQEPESTSAVGGLAGAVGNAILRFRRAGVTHVLFVGTQGAAEFFWMPQAESQGYRPRYGLTTFSKPDFLQKNVPQNQLRGAVGLGWQPMVDVANGEDPGGRAGYDECSTAFGQAGLSFQDRNSKRVAMQYCDTLLFLRAAIQQAEDLNSGGLRASVEGLGSAHASPLAFATRFGAGRHYGAAAERTLVFSDDCRCFKYQGPLRPIS